MRTALFWVITQQVVVIYYGRFGTTYQSHLQGFGFLTLEDWFVSLSRNVDRDYHYSLRNNPEELWKTHFAQLLQKCSDVCHRGHGDASICVSSIKVHIRIHWTCNQGVYVSDSNQIMVAYYSVYGDFSPTLYFAKET